MGICKDMYNSTVKVTSNSQLVTNSKLPNWAGRIDNVPLGDVAGLTGANISKYVQSQREDAVQNRQRAGCFTYSHRELQWEGPCLQHCLQGVHFNYCTPWKGVSRSTSTTTERYSTGRERVPVFARYS
jgi:hypothetical protein